MRTTKTSIGGKIARTTVLILSLSSPALTHGYDIATEYFSLGGTLFSPSGYNLMAKYNQRYLDFTISGMYIQPYYAVEGSIDYNLFNTRDCRNGPGLFCGYAQQKPIDGESKIYNAYQENMSYAEIHYFWDWGTVNAAFGLGYGFQEKPFVFPVFDIGAKFDFIDSKNILKIDGVEPHLFRESRDPVLTGILSVFPGGGYYYLGEWGRGVIATGAVMLTSGNAFAAGYVDGSKSPWFIGSYILSVGVQVFTMVDSVLLSTRPVEGQDGVAEEQK